MKVPETPIEEGWFWPINSRKAHYYRDGMSLCRRWTVLLLPTDTQRDAGGGPDDCKSCHRKRSEELRDA